MTLPIVLSVVLPAILFIASLCRLLGCLKRRGDGAIEYVWATGYSMVSCLAAVWLAADLASLSSGALSPERASTIVNAGPSLFVSLGVLLVLRPIVTLLVRVIQFTADAVRNALSKVFGRQSLKGRK